ncbi:hypothetical protein NBRC3257_2644 [Gluconobacter thailandicus NBRC 3257]|uniref:Replication protein n=1 Tax=Gluconobacter thailandicus NBRC 3257 TaxID=1381097 RepID=A0ABQ0IZL1_GLUTH|nr:hypothetical protein NBRC3257_2644 [Gluconobacter thailandicus NBRC 3257]
MPGRRHRTDRPIQLLTAISRGCGLTSDDFDSYAASREAVISQTERIADSLEVAGIQARDQGRDITLVGELTGECERITGFRRLHLLPEFAQRHRHRMIRRLSFFLEHCTRGRTCRYAVATSGQRVPWHGDLKGRRAEFLNRINRWSSEARRKYGVEVIYRGDNDTFCRAEGTTADGVNLHADLVYRPMRRLSPETWDQFLRWSRDRLGGVHWRDCGALRNASAVVRYVLKLSWGREGLTADDKADGLVGIDELTPDELAWYYHATLGVTRVKPLRSFQVFCKSLSDNREEIRWVPGPGGKRELRRVQRPRLEPRPPAAARDGQPVLLENIVLGRTAAHPRFSSVCEPCSIVLGFTGTPTTEIGHSGLDMIMNRCDQAARWAERNTQRLQEAARLTVHCVTSGSPSEIMRVSSPSESEDLNPPSSGPSLPSSQPTDAYKPTIQDFEQLSAFYRDLNPRLTDAQVRASVMACGPFWEGPIGPAIEKMRSRVHKLPHAKPAEAQKVIILPIRKRRIQHFPANYRDLEFEATYAHAA